MTCAQACYDKYMILSRNEGGNEGVEKAKGEVVDLSHGEG